MVKRLIILALCILAVLLTLASVGSSLSCYQCNSYINKSCETIDATEDAIYLQPCGKSEILCRWEYHTIRGEYRVIRSCGRTKHKNPCYMMASAEYKSQICQCELDGCNAAVKPESHIFTLLSIILISIYLLR